MCGLRVSTHTPINVSTNASNMKEIEQYIHLHAFSKALTLCDELLYQGDSNVSVLVSRGWCLYKIGFTDEARDLFENIFLDGVNTKHNYSYVDVIRLYDFFWSVAAYSKLIDICASYLYRHPQESNVLRRLAAAHSRLAEYRLAAMFYRRALTIDANASTEYNLGLTLLQLGEYDEGLALYEKRHDVNGNKALNESVFSIPRWCGEPVKDKGVIVWCEQGLGDVIQFSRYLALLTERGATVTLLLAKQYETLAKLLSTLSGVIEVALISDGNISLVGRYHYHMPLMSAMYHFSLQPNVVPAQIPYLHAPSNTGEWGAKFTRLSSSPIKVGVVWSTLMETGVNAKTALVHHLRNEKSVPFSVFSDLFSIEGVSFVNVKHPINEQEKAGLEENGVAEFSKDIAHFADTAALIDQLDVVISIDTSVVHLAGAMGKPTMTILPYDSDWRWQQHRDDSPWYPTMRLYRQTCRDQWSDVIERIADTLEKTVIEYSKTGIVCIKG
jgi:tetratricopeptide (TPR) repeat protein